MQRYQRELAIALCYAALLAILAVATPGFYANQWQDTFISGAPLLVATVGMTLVILARHIDISIGSQLSVCAVAAGLMARAGLPMPVVVLCTLGLGAALGAANGLLIAGLGLPSIVVTLATMVVLRDGLRWWIEGELIKTPAGFQWLGLPQSAGQWLLVVIALLVFAGFAWGLRFLAAGRAVYATGSDPASAWLMGIRPRRVVFGVFVLMGALTALAALLNVIRFPDVSPKKGEGLELEVIAAVVVGGVAISGGRGSLIGPLLGLLLLSTLGPALVFFGIDAHWEKAIQGSTILLAVAADALNWKRRKHGAAKLATA